MVAALWAYAAYAVAIAQWFVILFTGQRHEGMLRFQRDWLGDASRVYSYSGLLHDTFPEFGARWGSEPVHFRLDYRPAANRLTNAIRLIVAIPVLIATMYLLGIAVAVVAIVAWFAIVITGRLPRRLYDFLTNSVRIYLNTLAYLTLTTDDSPLSAWDQGTNGSRPPGDFSDPVGIASAQPTDWGLPTALAGSAVGAGSLGGPPAPPPAGWHPDPHGQQRLRYWAGQRWTEHGAD